MLTVKPADPADCFHYSASDLIALWPQLHALDNHALPDPAALQQEWRSAYPPATDWSQLSQRVLDAWLAFHNGLFDQAYALGQTCGPAGDYVTHLAVNSHGAYQLAKPARETYFAAAVTASNPPAQVTPTLEQRYVHALNLGRYADSLPTTRAISSGVLVQFKKAIEHCLQQAPNHVPSVLAYAALMSEVIAALGDMAARVTFGTHSKKVLGYYQQIAAQHNAAPVIFLEHAKGLQKLDARRHRAEIERLLTCAVQAPVLDTLDRYDQREAQQLREQLQRH